MGKKYLFVLSIFLVFNISSVLSQNIEASHDVLERYMGTDADRFELSIDSTLKNAYKVVVKDNKVFVSASDEVALCRGAYDFLTNATNSIISWSGNNINIPNELPEYSSFVQSPYQYHFYFNIVTHGYTTPYWGWERWEKELDWMAVHGLNMPLLPGAHEAILLRVFKKIGLSKEDIDSYFTGPAHFPWNKMGNITGWDGNLPDSYFEKQIELNHHILNRIKELGMSPIIPAFAGFIPAGIQKIYPKENIRELHWGGFPKENNAYILDPGSKLFIEIGKMYIEEYEKEFGKQKFYLADSFNELDVPVSSNNKKALEELAGYGESVFKSINLANSDATWVMQGWTFPFHRQNGEVFWTPERLSALMSKVPDDKLLILDLANDYNRLWWKIDPSWKNYSGFFGKQWIYSFIPNMGGKTAFNGRLDLYAKMPIEALKYKDRGNLVGYGFAPEGIENNEIIYELLSDIGWKNEEIDLNSWEKEYCLNRYGFYNDNMKKAYEFFNKSCFGSFTDHPRNAYQFRPTSNEKASVTTSEDLGRGVEYFLKCSEDANGSKLYQSDAIEFTVQFLGLEVDNKLNKFKKQWIKNYNLLDEALVLMADMDRLLESHPNWRLETWNNYARKWGTTKAESDKYEANARRLVTTWGGGVNEYAAKTWSGLIRDYYIPRWKLYYEAKKNKTDFDIIEWEENWINSSGVSEIEPFENPLEKAKELFKNNN